jgi:hypothetical protein
MANVKNNIYKDKNYPSLIILDAKKWFYLFLLKIILVIIVFL